MLQLSGDKGVSCSRLWLEDLGRGPRRKPHGLRAKSQGTSGDAEPRAVSVGSSLWKGGRAKQTLSICTMPCWSTLPGRVIWILGLPHPGGPWTFATCLHLQVRHPTRVEYPPSFLLMLSLCQGARERISKRGSHGADSWRGAGSPIC